MEQLLTRGFELSASDLGLFYVLNRSYPVDSPIVKSVFDCVLPVIENTEWFGFINDCEEMIVLNNRNCPFFSDLFFHGKMKSALALPVFADNTLSGMICFNSIRENHYNAQILKSMDKYARQDARLFLETHKVIDNVLAPVS